jgi:hypothetical protein
MLVEMKPVFAHLTCFFENAISSTYTGCAVSSHFFMAFAYKTFVDEKKKKRGEMGWDASIDKRWQRCQWKELACPPDFMSIEPVMVVHDYKRTRERWAKVASAVVLKKINQSQTLPFHRCSFMGNTVKASYT